MNIFDQNYKRFSQVDTPKDIIHLSGKVEKIPLPMQDFNEALTFAEEELRVEWELFRMKYLQEVQNE